MPQFRNYYEILGVSKTAPSDEIRSAFRSLARKYHPDVAKDKKSAEEKFKEINEAYEVLGDEEKRRKYDDFGANWQAGAGNPGGFPGGGAGSFPGGFPQGGNWQQRNIDGEEGFSFGGTGFSDFFEQLFGARRTSSQGGGFGGMGARARKGEDIESDILVSIEEAFHGATRSISFRRGNGKPESYTVKIPKGVRQGQRIRLAGVGQKGSRGGQAGDLFLRVKYERHPYYEISDSDLVRRVEIPAWDAVLGCSIEVPTLEGLLRIKIPEGSRNNKRFRVPGRGLPTETGTRGDYYAVLEVTLPPSPLTDTERDCWKKIATLRNS